MVAVHFAPILFLKNSLGIAAKITLGESGSTTSNYGTVASISRNPRVNYLDLRIVTNNSVASIPSNYTLILENKKKKVEMGLHSSPRKQREQTSPSLPFSFLL